MVVSTHLKSSSQIGSFPQGSGWKYKILELPPRSQLITELLTTISHQVSGQITIIPKPEFRGFWGKIPLLNHHLRWPTGGKRRYNLPRLMGLVWRLWRSSIKALEALMNSWRSSTGAPSGPRTLPRNKRFSKAGYSGRGPGRVGWLA